MSFIKKIGYNLLRLIKKLLYEYTFESILFVLTLTMLRIIDVVYKIESFNHIISAVLFFFGVGLYKMCRKLLANKGNILIFFALIIVTIIVALITKKEYLLKQVSAIYQNYIDIQKSFYESKETYYYQYLPMLAVLIPGLTVLSLYLNDIGFANLISLACGIYLLNLWYAAELFQVKVYLMLYFIAALAIYMKAKLKKLKRYQEKQNIKISVNHTIILQYVVVLAVFVGGLSYIFVEAFGVKNVFVRFDENRLKNKAIMEKGLNNRYKISYSGYHDSSEKLGGPIELNYDRVFRVKAEGTYYLKGSVKDFYDGFIWKKLEDRYEKLSYLNRRTKTESLKDTDKKIISIYPDNMDTSTLFAPNYTFNISLKKGTPGKDEDDSFIVLGSTGNTNSYTAEFYDYKKKLEGFSYKSGDSKLAITHFRYLQLPNNISQSTYDLVNDITKGLGSNEDKVKAIEEYLSKNYLYSLKVSDIPEGREFVDNFLFNEKKGYCTYFATATAIMCRIAGIPSRYVEGFSMADKKDYQGLYEVTNDLAHAWAEVLVKPEEDLWVIVDPVGGAGRDENSVLLRINQNGPSSTNPFSNSGGASQVRTKAKPINSVVVLLIIGLTAVFATAISLIVRIVIVYRYKNKILAADSTIPLYTYVRKKLGVMSSNKQLPEDDFVWIQSIEDLDLKEALTTLIEAVYDEFYGKRLNSDLDKEKIYKTVEDYMRRVMKRHSFIISRLLLK